MKVKDKCNGQIKIKGCNQLIIVKIKRFRKRHIIQIRNKTKKAFCVDINMKIHTIRQKITLVLKCFSKSRSPRVQLQVFLSGIILLINVYEGSQSSRS